MKRKTCCREQHEAGKNFQLISLQKEGIHGEEIY